MTVHSNSLEAAKAHDAALPATAFRINGDGAVLEGIEIELNHPLTSGQPAIFVGKQYIKRNFDNGCIYRETGPYTGTVRRLSFRYNAEIPYASRQNRDSKTITLHVNPHVELADNVTLLENFYYGVQTDAGVVAMSKGEMLVEFSKPFDDSTLIFYSDGRVVRVVRKDNSLMTVKMSLQEQAEARIDLAVWNISYSNDVKEIDQNFHQLVAVMAVAGRRNEAIRDRIMDILEETAHKGLFAKSVLDHASTVLDKHYPVLGMRLRSAYVPRVPVSFAAPANSTTPSSNKKGIPADRKQKLAERRHRDAARAADTKGSSGGGGNKGQKGAKKK